MSNTITIVTTIWKRHALTRIVLQHYAAMREQLHGLNLICCGSEGEASKSLAESCGWDYVEYPNEPLSQKHNALFEAARRYDSDLLVLIGSDDLLPVELLHWYLKNVPAGYPHLVGLKDLYFYNLKDRTAIYFPGYGGASPKTIGAGRCFSRYVLQQMNYRPWGKECINRGLDTCSTSQMKRLRITEIAYSMADIGIVAVDIKDMETSLTPYDRIKRLTNFKPVPPEQIEAAFPCILNFVHLKHDTSANV